MPLKLAARPPLHILSIDNDSYPNIFLTLRARQPHLDFVKKDQEPEFRVYEIYAEAEKKMDPVNVQVLKKEAQYLNLVWIVDASLSVHSRNFARTIAFSNNVISSLQKNDRMAIYSAKEEPRLLSDFSSDPEGLRTALRHIRHNAKVTRLYDAIYSGIYTAQSALQSGRKKPEESRTVVVLLTDGKEEFSYFNDNDCYELSSIGKRLNIPVYVVLFDGKTKGQTIARRKSLHYRLLKRLTLKTGGSLIVNPVDEENSFFSKKLRRLLEPIYQLRYTSSYVSHTFPGTQVIVRVTLKEGDYAAINSFRVPWLGFFTHSSSFVSLAGGLALALSIVLAAISIFLIRRSLRKSRPLRIKETLAQEEDYYPLLKKQLEAEYSQNYKEKDEYSEAASKTNKAPKESEEDRREETLSSLRFLRRDPDLLMEDERSLYMREYSYRMLQLALRGSRPYRRAALRTVVPSQPPRKRTYDLFLDNTLLGNGRWSHIPVRDPAASPVHARVKRVDQRFVIYDLMSGSGLYVNDRKVLRPLALRHGDDIRIGRTYFTFLGRN